MGIERRRVKGQRSVYPQWHQRTVPVTVTRIVCDCGTLMYEGPPPTFCAVSCPHCGAVRDMKRKAP